MDCNSFVNGAHSGGRARRSQKVKYLLLIYRDAGTWMALSEQERVRAIAEADGVWKELVASGEWVGGEALADPAVSRSVRVRNGEPTGSDGPYLNVSEQLAGYVLVDCDSEERAVAIAARWPDARYWGMEVRPLMSHCGTEM